MGERSYRLEGRYRGRQRAGVGDGREHGLREHDGGEKECFKYSPDIRGNLARLGCDVILVFDVSESTLCPVILHVACNLHKTCGD